MADIMHQWELPSESNPDRSYKVTEYEGGVWKCSCPHWIFRCQKAHEDCKHITDVKNGVLSDDPQPEYKFELAKCKQVSLQDDRITIRVPLRPADDVDFLATIIYDLLELGVTWQQVKEFENLPRQWSKAAVQAHVALNGRKVYREWIEERGWTGFEYVRINRD